MITLCRETRVRLTPAGHTKEEVNHQKLVTIITLQSIKDYSLGAGASKLLKDYLRFRDNRKYEQIILANIVKT